MFTRGKKHLDFSKGKFLVDGKERELWFVGGIGDVYVTGNKCLITNAALKKLLSIWVEKSHI